ncbi:hypothetical protein WU85_11000 [Corynebacterium striatum]|nr:hypothetical protein WU85_11000 [Corynebacterium striatum]
MHKGLVSGLTKSQLATHIKHGRVTKIARGLNVWGRPTPLEVLWAVQQRYPQAVATGRTAAQLYLKREVTLPLELAAPKRLPASTYYSARRSVREQTREVLGCAVQNPLLALAQIDWGCGIELCEALYAGHRGRENLEADRAEISSLHARAQELLRSAVLFTDSSAEIAVARALQQAGLKIECNVFIGVYRWDIVIPSRKIAIEINGLKFHSELGVWIRDHWKNNEAVLRGWRTLRYTGHCVAHHLDYIVEQVAQPPNWSRRFYSFVHLWHKALLPKPWEEYALPPEPEWVHEISP